MKVTLTWLVSFAAEADDDARNVGGKADKVETVVGVVEAEQIARGGVSPQLRWGGGIAPSVGVTKHPQEKRE